MSGAFTGQWKLILDTLRAEMAQSYERRRVVSVEDGRVVVAPDETAGEGFERSIPLVRLAGIQPDDEVLVVHALGGMVALGATIGGSTAESGSGGGGTAGSVAVVSDGSYDGTPDTGLPYLTTGLAELYLWNGIKGVAGSGGQVRLELDWAGSGGDYGTSFRPARDDHAHPAEDITSGTLNTARIPNLAASKITSGVFGTARLGTGTADSTVFLRGDGTWAAVPGGLSQENVEDIVGAMAHAGTGIAVTYSDLTSGLLIEVQDVPIGRVTGLQTALDAKAALSHNHPASAITSGVLHTSRLGTGTANSSVFLRGDGTWASTPVGVTETQITEINGFVDDVMESVASESIEYGILNILGSQTRIMGVKEDWLAATLDEMIPVGSGLSKVYDDVAHTVTLSLASHTHPVTDISATGRTASNYLRGDGTWATPTNTTYSVMAQAEAEAGTATTARTMSAARLKATILYYALDNSVWSAYLTTHGGAHTTIDTRLDDLEDTVDGLVAGGSPHSHTNLSILEQIDEPWTAAKESTLDLFYDLAVLKNTTSVAGWLWIIDEDTMVSDLATKVPTQQSVKAYVDSGLSGKANTSHNHAASQITSGVLATARLGTGTANSSVFLRGDGTWAAVPGGLTQEDVEDIVGAMAHAGTGIAITYSDLTSGLLIEAQDVPIDRVTGLQTALDGKALISHNHPASAITSGVMATARLGTGTANSSVFLRGDGTWAAVPGGLTQENVEDIVGAMVVGGTGVTATYNDAGNSLTIAVPNDHTHSNKAVLDQVTEPWTTGKQSTLNLFYDLAVLKNTGSVAGWVWVVDEDDMVSNLDTKLPTQQSVKAYVDAGLAGKSNTGHTHAASDVTSGTFADARIPSLAASKITSGVFATARLGTGTANSSVFLRGDGTWAAVPGGLTQENVEDIVGAMAVEGTGVDLTYNDTAGTLTIAVPNDHTHANKAVLDATTASFTTTIDSLINTHEAEINAIQSQGIFQIHTTITAGFIITDAGLVGAANDKLASALAVKSYVDSGLSGKAALSHNHPASAITSGVLATARLGTGTASSSTWLRGDGTWQTLPGGLDEEAVEDIVNGLIVGGTGVTTTYNDAANTLTIAVPNDHTHSNKAVLDQVTEPWTTGKQSTLDLFYDLAVLKNTTSVAGWLWVVDEDDMVSDLATKVPTQQSVKAYVDSGLAGKAAASHTHAAGDVTSGTFADARIPNLAASKVTSGTFATARLGTGTASSSTYLRGDGTWATIPGGLDQEGVEDIVGSMMSAGVGISIAYIDLTGTLAIQVQDVPIDRVTNLQTSLDGKAAASHTHPVADIQATGTPGTTTYLRGDGQWVTPPNTTYSAMSQAEMQAGTATTSRVITAQRVKEAVGYHPPAAHSHDWDSITGKPSTFTPAAHSHAAGDITSGVLATARLGTGTANSSVFLRGDGTWASVPGGLDTEGVQDIVGAMVSGGTGITATYNDGANTLTISRNALAIADIDGLQAALDDKVDEDLPFTIFRSVVQAHVDTTSGNPHGTTAAMVGAAEASHQHAGSDITSGTVPVARLGTGTPSGSNFLRGDGTWATPANTTYSLITQAEAQNSASTTARLVSGQRLAQAIATHPPATHSHAWGDITGKPSTFAPDAHTHAIADVTDLQTTLDGKVENNLSFTVFRSVVQAHVDTTSGNPHGITPAMIGAAEASHTHPVTDISATGRTSSNYLRGDGTWATPTNTTYSVISQAEAQNSGSTTARLVTGQRLAQAIATHPPASHSHPTSDVTGLDAALAGKVPVGWHGIIPLTTQLSTTSTSSQTASELNIPIGANEAYEVTYLVHLGGGANGMRIGISVPSGASGPWMYRGSSGAGSDETTWIDGAQASAGMMLDDLAKNAIFGGTTPTGFAIITAFIINGANAGNISLIYRATTSGQTALVGTGTRVSYTRKA